MEVDAEVQKVEAPSSPHPKKFQRPLSAEERRFEAAAAPLLDSSSFLVRLSVQRLSTAVQELRVAGTWHHIFLVETWLPRYKLTHENVLC